MKIEHPSAPPQGETPGFSHYSVMKAEVIEALRIKPDGVYVDGTVGGGGHSLAIAEKLEGGGRLVAFDQDAEALAAAKERLAPFSGRVELIHANFRDAGEILSRRGILKIDGALLDLGVSSFQFDSGGRGFSYMHSAPLDMRMDREQTLTAYDVVNLYGERELQNILTRYGEEKFAPRIARAIVREREKAPIRETGELAALIKEAIPPKARQGGHHPAKRSFQAIRIEVNGELEAIEPALRAFTSLLVPGGRLAVISFHSLEDRIVKKYFAACGSGCTCPREFPVCVCGKKPIGMALRAMTPTEGELAENPRSRSARLRVLEKL